MGVYAVTHVHRVSRFRWTLRQSASGDVRGRRLDANWVIGTHIPVVHVRDECLGGEEAEANHQCERCHAADDAVERRSHQRVGEARDRHALGGRLTCPAYKPTLCMNAHSYVQE